MLRKLIILAVVLALAGFGAFWLLTMPATVPASALGDHRADLAHGRIMFFAGGCAECHATVSEEDKSKLGEDKLKLGGGLALGSPFGTFYVPNISPDREDGIGDWNEADFVTAMTKGTSPDGEHYYPAFPYTSFQRMALPDIRDLFAFLKTLPPVKSDVPDHELPFPFTIRRGLGMWKLLFLDGKPFAPDASRSAQWNRGAYLVSGPGHCAECHSPRNFMGGIISSQRFAGGPNPEGEGWIPNITQFALKDWDEDDIAYLLETGTKPDGDSVGGRMVAVVRNTSQLPAEDRTAIAAYLKSLPPVEGPKKPAKK